ncbi:MAG: PIN domain-containing protein [Lachnospiraceae bacterium]
MKIMCDTNIFLDVMLEREPFVDNCDKILRLCEENKLEGYVTASCITDIFYLVRKYRHSNDLAYQAIGKILEIVKVCSVTNDDVLTAYQTKAKDFEDCLLATCAKSIHCSCIVTRNKKDLEGLAVLPLEPSELLQRM